MIYISAVYNTVNFKEWLGAFEENEKKRMQAGLRVENILRDKKNPGRIKVLMSIESIVAAEEYIEMVSSPGENDLISPDSVEFWDVYY